MISAHVRIKLRQRRRVGSRGRCRRRRRRGLCQLRPPPLYARSASVAQFPAISDITPTNFGRQPTNNVITELYLEREISDCGCFGGVFFQSHSRSLNTSLTLLTPSRHIELCRKKIHSVQRYREQVWTSFTSYVVG